MFSTKGIYGLRAMYELYKANKSVPLKTYQISERTHISKNYLEQLLGALRRAGLIKSIRGANGGYLLAKEPKDIKVLEILEILEGDIKLYDKKDGDPVLDLFFSSVIENVKKSLDISLEDFKKYEDRYAQYLHYSI